MDVQDEVPDYVEPCLRKTSESIESTWLSSSDFGECFVRDSETRLFPRLTAVYNGRALDIDPEMIHASLSGISVKHYHGKCTADGAREDVAGDEDGGEGLFCEPEEAYGLDLFGSDRASSGLGDGDNLRRATWQEFTLFDSHRPVCLRQKINFRNSFWNLHKPELSKLTWGQNYVSTATVIEHLHEHLLEHGPICEGFHEDVDRLNMLTSELDEYGRLKVLAGPRELPPDEDPVDLVTFEPASPLPVNPKCRTVTRWKPVVYREARFRDLSDDEEVTGESKTVHRSKEEFCLTIGRHVRKEPMKKSLEDLDQVYSSPEMCYSVGEEGGGFFFFDWLLGNCEEYEEGDTHDESSIDLEPIPGLDAEPCPALAMDDFCRAVAKADFSDLRCSPDDF